jgi:hypothetical protein
MGIEILKTPTGGGPDAGMFNLPPKFDQTKLAAEWVESSQVEMKRQRQVLQQAGVTADGWEVWKADPKDEPTVVHASGNKKFVLMCRDIEVQRQVNAIFGNVSKKILAREIKGETIAGEGLQDAGMLNEERLRREIGGVMESGGGDVTPNKVSPKQETAWREAPIESAAQEA